MTKELKRQINGLYGDEIWLLVYLTSGEQVDKLVEGIWLLVGGSICLLLFLVFN